MFISTRVVGSLAEGVFLLGQIAQEWNDYTEGNWDIRYDTDSWNHQIICNSPLDRECVVMAQIQEHSNSGQLKQLQPWQITRRGNI